MLYIQIGLLWSCFTLLHSMTQADDKAFALDITGLQKKEKKGGKPLPGC